MPENELQQGPAEIKPEFEGGNSRILFFAPEGGFKLQQGKRLRRRDNLSNPFPASGINKGNQEEVEFQKRQNDIANARGIDRNVHPLKSPDFKTKVGILNLSREGDTLKFDTKPSTFVMYNDDKNVGVAKLENQALREDLGEPLAVAMILFTAEVDGSYKLIIQHRGMDNRNYKDMIGASAAGFVDLPINTLNDPDPATSIPLDNHFIKSVAEKEMEEEVGLDPEDLELVEITGISEDLVRRHYEALLLGKVKLTAEEVKQKSIQKMEKVRGAFDFSEEFFVLDGTPEAIRIILTEVKNPIPSTHGDALVAAGRIMVVARDGEEAAKKWIEELEPTVRKNNAEIDRRAQEASGHPYEPKLAPKEQGLPDITSELKRTGLIE